MSSPGAVIDVTIEVMAGVALPTFKSNKVPKLVIFVCAGV